MKVILTSHAADRCRERGVTIDDIHNVMQTVMVTTPADRGAIKFQGIDTAGLTLYVVFKRDPRIKGPAIVVTVFRKGEG